MFAAWQVTCDLLESGCVGPEAEATAESWALLGPGALAGAALADGQFKTLRPTDALDVALALRDAQPADLEPPPEAPGRFSLKNVEHALCEYARWVRASDPARCAGLEVKPWAK